MTFEPTGVLDFESRQNKHFTILLAAMSDLSKPALTIVQSGKQTDTRQKSAVELQVARCVRCGTPNRSAFDVPVGVDQAKKQPIVVRLPATPGPYLCPHCQEDLHKLVPGELWWGERLQAEKAKMQSQMEGSNAQPGGNAPTGTSDTGGHRGPDGGKMPVLPEG